MTKINKKEIGIGPFIKNENPSLVKKKFVESINIFDIFCPLLPSFVFLLSMELIKQNVGS